MANVIPTVTDPEGRKRRPVSGDVLVDTLGNPLGSGKPTPNIWGVESTPVMTGDRVLTDTDKTVQFLDPNGVNRKVTLPVLSASTPYFVFWNVGSSGLLNIHATGGDLVSTLVPGEGCRVYSDGSSVIGVISQGFLSGYQTGITLMWGGDKVAGTYGASDNPTSISSVTGDELYHLAPVDCQITAVAWEINPGLSNDLVVTPYVNAAAQTPFTLYKSSVTRGVLTLETPISLSAGDFVSLSGNTDPGDVSLTLVGPKISGSVYRFGSSSVIASGNCLSVAGSHLFGESLSPGDAKVTVCAPVSGSLTKLLCYSSDASLNGANITVLKNGSPAAVLTGVVATLVGAVSLYRVNETINVAYAAGDKLEFQINSSGISTGAKGYLVDTGLSKAVLHFGGDITSPLNLLAYDKDGSFSTTTSSSIVTRVSVPFTGVPHIGWASQAVLTSHLRVYKNGEFAEVVSGSSGTSSGTARLRTKFYKGDYIEIGGGSVGIPGDTNACVVFG